MALQIRKAERRKAKLRLALCGPTGSGKTYSALRLSFGIGGKIGLIDTEHGSGDLYADLGDYDVISLEAPYTVPKYREAIGAFEQAGYDVIIIDSLSHAWAGEGGLLDKQGVLEKDTSTYKNSFATWRAITPEHNKLVEELLNSPAHIIATMRVKTEYVLEKNSAGKMAPRKIGLSPVQRDGVEYEFTVVMDIDDNHYARASKDRTSSFDGWSDQITEETGRRLKAWLDSGAEAPKRPSPDEEMLVRLEVALADADADKLGRILKHHETQHLKERLTGAMLDRYTAAVDAAVDRTTPKITTPPADGGPGWPGPPPDNLENKEAA